jgi:hypothetical protein
MPRHNQDANIESLAKKRPAISTHQLHALFAKRALCALRHAHDPFHRRIPHHCPNSTICINFNACRVVQLRKARSQRPSAFVKALDCSPLAACEAVTLAVF